MHQNITPEEYCRQKVYYSSSSFYYSFLTLDIDRRQAIFSVYAFCREVDDIVDECTDVQLAIHKLTWWRQEIRRMYNQSPTHNVTRALLVAVNKYNLEQIWFETILDGMEQDLVQSRYLDFTSLEQYCWRVAGVVGVISAHIFGFFHMQTLEYAKKLGLALQLINIIRDIKEDAARGRIYIPISDLQAHNISVKDILSGIDSAELKNLLMAQVQRAYDIYQNAISILPQEDRYLQRSGLVMGEIYKNILDEIIYQDYKVLEGKISISKMRKIFIAAKILLQNRKYKHIKPITK
jgi:15-cis-phytoene synthase